MGLLDHFRPPLGRARHWEGFHSLWTGAIVRQLNLSALPENYIAEPTIKLGVEVEADVATLKEQNGSETTSAEGNGAVATAVYAPPRPLLTFTADFGDADTFEIKVQKEEGGLRLVAAIELVSPRNKDRPGARAAFVRKCASYLQEGVALIIVDIVTSRPGNFHADLFELLHAKPAEPTNAHALYSAAYRCRPGKTATVIEAWPHALELGGLLPTLPLYLDEDLAVPVELDESYRGACEVLRI